MPAAVPTIPQLDRNLLAVDTTLSIASAVISSWLGASWWGSLIVAALTPALLTYVHHPGPGRRRRTAIGLALLALLHLLQSLLARLRGRPRPPRVPGVGRAVRLAELTAGVAFAITVVTLTAPELVLGDSLTSNRPLTLFPVNEPDACPAPEPKDKKPPRKKKDRDQPREHGGATPPPEPRRPLPPAVDPLGSPPDRTAPELELPEDIAQRADDDDGAMVRYSVRAVDAVDGTVKVSCRPPSGSRFPVGTTTVSCAAQDHSDNRASGDFEVRVSAPEVTPAPDPPPVEPEEPTPPPEPETPEEPEAPRAQDVPEDPPATPEPAPTPPTFTGPRRIIVDTAEPEGTPVSYPRPPAVDSNGRRARVVCSPTTVPAGTRLHVNCTATDRLGQSTQRSFLVWIRIVGPD